MSRLDHIYRSLLLTKFFTKGWGRPDNLRRLFEFRKIISDRDKCKHLVPEDYPIQIDKDERQKECRVVEGHFMSPFVHHVPGIMPQEVEIARFQMILPNQWPGHLKPVCLHLAGTGDHFYWRRQMLLARPLLKEAGIASILLENPYYGVRKPKQQLRSSLLNVSDLFVMGGALVLESLALFHWCERQGYGPLGITGISMGGHMASAAATNWAGPLSVVPCLSWTTASCIFTQMASLAATNWHEPIPLVPCLSWSTASTVFTQGVLSGAIPWHLLQEQYLGDKVYKDEITKLIHSPEQNRQNEAFLLGQNFAKNYPDSLEDMEIFQNKFYKGKNENLANGEFMTEYIFHENGNGGSQDRESNSAVRGNGTKIHPAGLKSNSAGYHTMSSSRNNIRHKSSSVDETDNTDGSESPSAQYSKSGKSNSYRLLNKLYISDTIAKLNWSQKKNMSGESLHFMRGVMDECTHLGNFSVPVDPSLIIIVAAKADAYIPRDSVLSLQDLWPGSEVRYVDSGHIGAFLFKQSVFRQAIIDAFDRQIKKYYS